MRIIVDGDRNINKLLLLSRIHEGNYVPGHYLLRLNTADGMLLCNTLTGELVLLSEEERKAVEALPAAIDPSIKELALRRYLVPEGCCEEQFVEQLRTLLVKKLEASRTIQNYNILPTTFCNARCFYCYENGIKHVHMTEETAEELIQFIAEHHNGTKVKLSWFGGEPTIGRERIEQICRGLDERNIPYESTMISNAYLFDDVLINHAKKAWKLKCIQITLDGTEEIYNRVKAYVGISDNPYQRVMRNISSFLDAGIRVEVRLNLDLHNMDDLSGLIDELTDRYHVNPKMFIYVTEINQDVGFDPIHHTQDDFLEINRAKRKLQEQLEANGWPVFGNEMLPGLRVSSCMADDPCSVQCTPEGILSKCEDMIYENVVGSLKDGIVDNDKVLWWRERTIYEGCSECPLYPSCTSLLAHCPVRQRKCMEEERKKKIEKYMDLMMKKYKTSKDIKNG